MLLKLDEITQIAREVASQHTPPLEVMAVSSDGGSERVELLITIQGCHSEPCRFVVGLSRTDAGEMEELIRTKFREILAAHR
jgi:hypothetical protein